MHHAGSRAAGPGTLYHGQLSKGSGRWAVAAQGPAGRPRQDVNTTLPLLRGTAASVAGVPRSSAGSVPRPGAPADLWTEGRSCCRRGWVQVLILPNSSLHLHGLGLRAAGGLK